MVKLRNEFITVDPRGWNHQADFTVRVGLGNGNREQNMVHLQTLAQMQEKIVASGGMNLLVTPKNIFNTIKEIGMNMGLKNIEDFLTDPEGKEVPQQDNGKAQVEAMKAQVDMQKLQLEAQKLEIEKQKLAFEGQKLQAEMQMEAEENQLKQAELMMEGMTERPIKVG